MYEHVFSTLENCSYNPIIFTMVCGHYSRTAHLLTPRLYADDYASSKEVGPLKLGKRNANSLSSLV